MVAIFFYKVYGDSEKFEQLMILLYYTYVTIIYPLVHNRYKVDFVVCACPYGRIKMSCIINQGPLSDYVILEKRPAWREDIMVLNTTLDGKTIKLSENLLAGQPEKLLEKE